MSYTVSDLVSLMARLRDPEYGCPWDVAQDFKSIAPYTLEEAYEVIDAIDRQDYAHLEEELGDLLLQVVFHSQMASEASHFNFERVVDVLVDKLIRRHPHVFPDGTLSSRRQKSGLQASDVKTNWDVNKEKERADKGQIRVLDDVPKALPSLKRAQKLQKRASKVGFDWRSIEPVRSKLDEEIHELDQAVAQNNRAAIEEELGDVLFSVTNLARHLKLDAEEVLRNANNKFTRRFEYVEKRMQDVDLDLCSDHQEQMEVFWEEAKRL